MLRVTDIMTPGAITINMDDRLQHVRYLFDLHKFHHLLMVDSHNKLMGVLSDRDLLKALSPNLGKASETTKDIATLNKRAHMVASRKPVTVKESDSLSTAVETFFDSQVSCLPVIDDNNSPVGIITMRDIIRILHNTARAKGH
ncbi:CBS domain-containing protein [Thalassotalea euphylliae]|uniref:CBS domain-containing protein n=1 Tax=Thalassotalea euphylliae TaxID=1655234 RepID=UPI00362AAEE8